MKDKQENKNGFIIEKKKNKPINKRRLGQRILVTIIIAVVFGLISSIVIVISLPEISKRLYPVEDKKIELDMVTDDVGITTSLLNPVDGTGMLPTIGNVDTNDIQKFYYDLYGVGSEAEDTLVQISGGKKQGLMESSDSFAVTPMSGIIISKDDTEVTVLCEQHILWADSMAQVTFNDGEKVSAMVQGYDSKTGLSVLRIWTSNIPIKTRTAIEAIKFGTSRVLSSGKLVIAVGNPLAEKNSILVGHVISNDIILDYVDGQCEALETNMVSKSAGGGFLLDIEGNLIGVITHDGDENGENNMLSAIGISDITLLIEKLANGEDIPYIGIRGKNIDAAVAKEQDLPIGVYVESVVADSPAMKAGMQKGDIIVKFGKTELTTARQFELILQTFESGDAVSLTVKRYSSTGYKSADCYVTISSQNKD